MLMKPPISYKDKLLNKSITEYFGIEESDLHKDKKEDDNDSLGDYDYSAYDYEEKSADDY